LGGATCLGGPRAPCATCGAKDKPHVKDRVAVGLPRIVYGVQSSWSGVEGHLPVRSTTKLDTKLVVVLIVTTS
jgi:hypothetical protein